MQFEIITIFPEFFAGPLDYGIVRRAREARIADVRVHDLRAFAHDRHRTVDDRPFGGGEGMVLKPEPLFEAVESLLGQEVFSGSREEFASKADSKSSDDALLHSVGARHAMPPPDESTPIAQAGTAIVLLSASGKLFRQETARRFAQLDRIIFLCGRYEGVDERVTEHLATDELSIGDYVLSGGELGAALILDAVTRLLPGALGNEDSTINESFSAVEAAGKSAGSSSSHQPPVTSHVSPATNHLLLDYPHYTRPAEFRGWPVPEVLLGGNHEEIRKWRQKKALEKTRRNRPDLWAKNISS
ncbi:MAG TPA: tRNA (guanine(37)-N(1))-methyltransferase [Candidatus Acidoferrales bacterium]|jgi:tRNA (guanine37-N1)-methyltransferase|nr:tRNA (guanine(37)-N(1))-methyltransferase [Candidatus Acidoferrales bacterium]